VPEHNALTAGLATLGGGCFWCLEAVYDELAGVTSVQSGYAGGHTVSPTYEQVCTGTTGHAEVVRIAFDPAVITFDDLLDVFFTIHDPTTRDRQGNDIGPQYRSIILYHDAEQRETATRKIASVEASRHYSRPIVTELQPLGAFHPAEDYHRDYFVRNPDRSYCQLVVAPKVRKARHALMARLRPGVG
jgi:peptide-methionine (S)-S-oxide reductase